MDYVGDGTAANHVGVRGRRDAVEGVASPGEPQSRRWDVLAGGAFALTLVALALIPEQESFALVVTPVIAIFVIACAGSRSDRVAAIDKTDDLRWQDLILALHGALHRADDGQQVAAVGALRDGPLRVRVALMAFYYLACFAVATACYFVVEVLVRRATLRVASTRRATR
jgi:fumarate reductase subunit D